MRRESESASFVAFKTASINQVNDLTESGDDLQAERIQEGLRADHARRQRGPAPDRTLQILCVFFNVLNTTIYEVSSHSVVKIKSCEVSSA